MDKSISKKWSFKAKTVEDAIDKALKDLECSREDINVKVVCEEKRGLFGMDGADPAKIIVSMKKK